MRSTNTTKNHLSLIVRRIHEQFDKKERDRDREKAQFSHMIQFGICGRDIHARITPFPICKTTKEEIDMKTKTGNGSKRAPSEVAKTAA